MLVILSIGFFTDSGRCFLRPKLSILYSKYATEILYIYIYSDAELMTEYQN